MPISSGLFNHTLTLQTMAFVDDGMGGQVETWSDTGSFKARISSLSAQERMAQDKTTTFATHRVYCDNMSVTTADRIKWGNYYFKIIGIKNPSELYYHLEIDVVEIDG